VDPIRLGGDVRLLRRQRGWTQARLASEAHVSRWSIVQVEAGRGPALRLDDLIRVAAALGGYLSVRLLFHGETLDRMRDRRHAALVDAVVTKLRDAGWEIATEVSFNVYGERGSIDVLAFDPETGTLLVVEVKSVVPDVGGMLMTLDRKVRHAREIAAERGWLARSVARLLVLPESTTTRRRVHDHAATFANAFPQRNVAVRRWLRGPRGRLSGLWFLPDVRTRDTRRGPRSGRQPRARPSRTSDD
jgi:DNA-binding XRE family transcriptional regulator